MSILDHLRRDAGDDGIRRNIMCDQRTRGDDGSGAHIDTFHDHGVMADPDVIANGDVDDLRLE
ncbi:hypothetical protein D3C85_1606760 [compost metagenome]